MNIVVIANFPTKLDGINRGRFMTIAEMLANRGHHVQIIISDFDHETKSHRGDMPSGYKIPIVQLHEPGYLKNVSIKRFNDGK